MNFRYLFKDILIYGAGDVLLKATAFITMPIYTRIFQPEDYGVWSFILTIITLMSHFLLLGGDSGYARYFFEAKTEREKQILTSTTLAFLAVWSFALVALCLPLSGLFSAWSFDTRDHAALFALGLLTAPVTLVNSLCGQVLRNQFRAKVFTLFNVLTTLLTIGAGLFAVLVLDLGIAGLVAGGLAANLLVLPARLWSTRGMLRFEFSKSVLRDVLVYGVPLVPMGIAYWVFMSSDRIILGKLSTLEQLGLYAVAASFVSVLSFINGAIGQAWSPHLVRLYEEERDIAPLVVGQVLTYILLGFGALCVGISAFALEALKFLSTPAYYGAAMAVGALALATMFYASTQVTAAGISLAKKTQYFALYSWLAAVLNVLLNLALVPRFGMVGSSWATAASFAFLTLAYALTGQKFFPIVYEKQRILVIVSLTVLFTVTAPLLPELSLTLSLFVKTAYCLLFFLLLFALRAIDGRITQAALTVLRGRKMHKASRIA